MRCMITVSHACPLGILLRPNFPAIAAHGCTTGQALRDLDYMQAKATQGVEHDPFLLQSSKLLELSILRDAGFEMAETGLAPPVDALHPVFPGVGRTARIRAARLHNKYTNFAFGLGGGLALIVPMIIMTMIPNIISSLVTTSAFVIAFSSIIAWRSDLKPQEVLAVTAGYAAVLVVFVGTNQSRGNGS